MVGKLITPSDRYEMLKVFNLNKKDCAEIGVLEGHFSDAIMKQNPQSLLLVDPWIEQSANIYPGDHNNVNQAQCDARFAHVMNKYKTEARVRVMRDFSFSASQKTPDRSLDFVYIDAVHTMESVLIDMTSWWPKVRAGGILAGHDFTGKYTGVKMAVDSFCKVTNNNIYLLTMEPWASWAIRKGE